MKLIGSESLGMRLNCGTQNFIEIPVELKCCSFISKIVYLVIRSQLLSYSESIWSVVLLLSRFWLLKRGLEISKKERVEGDQLEGIREPGAKRGERAKSEAYRWNPGCFLPYTK